MNSILKNAGHTQIIEMPHLNPSPQIHLEVAIRDDDWGHSEVHWIQTFSPVIEATLSGAHLKREVVEISVRLAGRDELQRLNNEFRGKNQPTNVLSFPAYKPEELIKTNDPFLGDLAFAYSVIAEEAHAQGKTFQDHLTHLLVHGTLHLLGYDHMVTEEAHEMESLEVKILSFLNISNPY